MWRIIHFSHSQTRVEHKIYLRKQKIIGEALARLVYPSFPIWFSNFHIAKLNESTMYILHAVFYEEKNCLPEQTNLKCEEHGAGEGVWSNMEWSRNYFCIFDDALISRYSHMCFQIVFILLVKLFVLFDACVSTQLSMIYGMMSFDQSWLIELFLTEWAHFEYHVPISIPTYYFVELGIVLILHQECVQIQCAW